MDLKENYRRIVPVDLSFAKNFISDGVGSKWAEEVTKFSKLDLFVQIKLNFGTENYLKMNLDRYEKSLLSQFRYGILPLEIETGRYKGLDRENRL